MNILRRSGVALALALPVLLAQAPAALAQPAPSPDTLKVARELVAKTAGDKTTTLQAMGGPLVGMMQQMGIRQPDRAQAIVQEGVMPLLNEHYDELLDVQAKSYAAVLSVSDMQAAIAFYNTPAGQSLIRAQPQLARPS